VASSTPTMAGFDWSGASVDVPMEAGEDGWCLRDAICQLFGWNISSENRSLFVRWPKGTDDIRLTMYLGLTVFEVSHEHWDVLVSRAAHPGVARFIFPAYGKAHTVYVPDVRLLLRWWPTPDGRPSSQPSRRTGWPLGPEHMKRGPLLGAVLIDEREPPRAA
jgi:hypothetical protein